MEWEYFYSKIDDWSEKTIIRNISQLENYGPANEVVDACDYLTSNDACYRLAEGAVNEHNDYTGTDIIEFYDYISEEQVYRLLELALIRGLAVSSGDILESADYMSEEDFARVVRLALDCHIRFSALELEDLSAFLDEKTLTYVVKLEYQEGLRFPEGVLEELACTADEKLIHAIDKKQGTHVFDDDDEFDFDEESKPDKKHTLAGIGALFELNSIRKKLSKKDTSPRFRIGDHVRVKYSGLEGSIVDIHHGRYMVSMRDGRKVESYSENEIESCW